MILVILVLVDIDIDIVYIYIYMISPQNIALYSTSASILGSSNSH